MTEFIPISLSFLVIVVIFVWESVQRSRRHDEQLTDLRAEHTAEREEWRTERQQLLDRIQAPTFAEYKHAEVKVIKAQNGEKEPASLEPL